MIKGSKLFCHLEFQISETVEYFVPASCYDRCSYLTNRALYRRLLFWLAHLSRHDRRDIVRAKSFIVISKDDLSLLRVSHDSSLKIVADCTGRNSSEVFIHIDMTANERIHLHVETRLNI